jgi:magnesium transporter
MEARIVRTGTVEEDPIPAERLGETVGSLDQGSWVWVDAVDPSEDQLGWLQSALGLHDLAVEDVRHRDQRPKLDLYPAHAFAVFRPLLLSKGGIEDCEMFLFAAERFLVTIRFSPAFDLEPAVKRWQVVASRGRGPAPALYAIVDEIVDGYLGVVEELEDRADDLESRVFHDEPAEVDRPSLQIEILKLRREAVQLRRHAVPMRQAVDRLADDSELVTEQLAPYLRDVSDHLIRTIELTDGVREVLTTVVDIRMAQAANQLNEVMKKLTAWAGIILVPTLIAGIYGMNFRHMPELDWWVGYPLALGLMSVSAVVLYLLFRKRGWL